MSDKDLHKRVSELSSINIELPQHQRAQRAQLLAQYSSQHVSQNFRSAFIRTIQEGIHTMKRTSKAKTVVGTFASLAVVAAVAALVVITPSSASATEQLSKTNTIVEEMSLQEKEALRQRFGEQLAQHLAEAQRAADLTYISAEEFKNKTGLDPAVKLPDMSIKSFLAYTAPDGTKGVLAVDTSDKPVLLLLNIHGVWSTPPVAQASPSEGKPLAPKQ